MRKHFFVVPKEKIQAFNSCFLWYYFQLLCLINYNDNIQSRKYIEAKDFVNSIKDSSFYFDCLNYYQYIMNFDKKLIEINPNQLFDDEDYFYCTSDKFTLLENIKIHKLCFLNQFMDFIKLIKIKTGQDLIFKPGISELNKFREQNEELVDFIIVLEYNLNFLELSSKNDKEVIKQLQSLINKIKDIRKILLIIHLILYPH